MANKRISQQVMKNLDEMTHLRLSTCKKKKPQIKKKPGADPYIVNLKFLNEDLLKLNSLRNLIVYRDELAAKVDTWDDGKNMKYDVLDYKRDFKLLVYFIVKVEKATKRLQSEDSQIKRIINNPEGLVSNADPQDLAATIGGSCS